jgi:hypothetical protein
MVAPSTRTYILESTRDFFIRWPDEPCSGATPLRPTASMAALCYTGCSGADLPTSATVGVDPWPPPATRETYISGALPRRISND